MTFRERLEQDIPEHVSDEYCGGCRGCPSDYGYEAQWDDSAAPCGKSDACRKCWDREMPQDEEISVRKPSLAQDEERGAENPNCDYRAEILRQAAIMICGTTAKQAAGIASDLKETAALWSVYVGAKITAADAAVMMAILEAARAKAGKDAGIFERGAGYMALAGELKTDEEV